MNIIKNYTEILNQIKKNTNLNPQVIAVSKTFDLDHIKPLINLGLKASNLKDGMPSMLDKMSARRLVKL
jgi:uncharacterized pyridoxal phosphate-containing UPF0001 family protein